MGIERLFKGKQVGVDTSIFIYYIEENPNYLGFLADFFLSNYQGNFQIATSVITLLELLVLPYRNSREDLIRTYKTIFEKTTGIELVNLTPPIAEIAARLRATYQVRTPDSIEVGTAIHMGLDCFFTNDKRLTTMEKEIPIIVLDNII